MKLSNKIVASEYIGQPLITVRARGQYVLITTYIYFLSYATIRHIFPLTMISSVNQIATLLVESFYGKVCDQSDRNMAEKIISPSVSFYATGSDVPVGFDDFFNYVSMFQKSLEFKHFIREHLVVDKTALIYWLVKGCHKKELLGFAPTNKDIVYSGMTLFYFDDQNLITKAITVFDEKNFIDQLQDSPEQE